MEWCFRCGSYHSPAGCPTGFPLPTAPASAAQGWECPRCHAIHSPYSPTCWCTAPTPATPKTESIVEAATALLKKLAEVHESLDYKSVWALAQHHGGQYQGPDYTKELDDLKQALESP